jgi:hypothetical protein
MGRAFLVLSLLSTPAFAAKCNPRDFDLLAAALSTLQLREKFLSYRNRTPRHLRPELTTEQENQRYQAFVENLPPENHYRFVHISLVPMREMNSGALETKEHVDAARNLFREILLQELYSAPFVRDRLLEQMIGFKQMEFVFSPTTQAEVGAFEGLLSGAIRDAQMRFDKEIKHYLAPESIDMQHFLRQAGPVSDFRAWHQVGMGIGHPDFAATQVKLMQYNPDRSPELKAHRFNVPLAETTLESAETSRVALAEKFADTKLMAPYEGKGQILTRGALEVLRKLKNLPEEFYLKEVIPLAGAKLGVTLTPNDARHLRTYFRSAECFSPAVREAETVSINFAAAKHGLITVDIGGQGHVNAIHNMGALMEASHLKERRAVNAVLLTRKFDEKATARLHGMEARFQKALELAGIADRARFSGDDGGVVLTKPLAPGQYEKLLDALASDPELADFRIAYSQPGKRTPNSADHSAAETLEKDLRESLRGVLTDTELASIAIASQLNLDSGKVELLVTGKATAAVLEKIQKASQKPVRKVPTSF